MARPIGAVSPALRRRHHEGEVLDRPRPQQAPPSGPCPVWGVNALGTHRNRASWVCVRRGRARESAGRSRSRVRSRPPVSARRALASPGAKRADSRNESARPTRRARRRTDGSCGRRPRRSPSGEIEHTRVEDPFVRRALRLGKGARQQADRRAWRAQPRDAASTISPSRSCTQRHRRCLRASGTRTFPGNATNCAPASRRPLRPPSDSAVLRGWLCDVVARAQLDGGHTHG